MSGLLFRNIHYYAQIWGADRSVIQQCRKDLEVSTIFAFQSDTSLMISQTALHTAAALVIHAVPSS